MSAFTQQLANICLAEYHRWDDGNGREDQGRDQAGILKDFYLFVKEYWVSIGNDNLTGRTEVNGIRPAWSAAFVSFCIRRAGALGAFQYSEAHCHYIAAAMRAADGNNPTYGFVARKPETYTPVVGDIVCAGREYAKRFNYDQAKMVYEADSFYPSHGDIIVEMTPTYAQTIGGNISNNVARKRLPLDQLGHLRPRTVGAISYPWIAVLNCRL